MGTMGHAKKIFNKKKKKKKFDLQLKEPMNEKGRNLDEPFIFEQLTFGAAFSIPRQNLISPVEEGAADLRQNV